MKFPFLDGEHDIKFSFADVRKIQEMPEPDTEDPQAGAKRTIEVLVLGLKRSDPEITAEKVADIVDMETFPELLEAVNAAIGRRKIESPNPSPES
jgi:hypothetical protein